MEMLYGILYLIVLTTLSSGESFNRPSSVTPPTMKTLSKYNPLEDLILNENGDEKERRNDSSRVKRDYPPYYYYTYPRPIPIFVGIGGFGGFGFGRGFGGFGLGRGFGGRGYGGRGFSGRGFGGRGIGGRGIGGLGRGGFGGFGGRGRG